MKKLTVTIGIPAYNEEKNIKELIASLSAQKKLNYVLSKIIIYSDGSTDNTVSLVKEINNKEIEIFEGLVRSGKKNGLNYILKKANTDILVLMDADISFKNRLVLEELIHPFYLDEQTMVVGTNSLPYKGNTFIEKAVYSSMLPYLSLRENVNGGNNIYACTGACMALRKKFYSSLIIPNIVLDDDYIYLICRRLGYGFSYAGKAIVHYKLPNNVKDYIRQIVRSTHESTKLEFSKDFSDILKKELVRPKALYFKSFCLAFISNPLGISVIILLRLMIRPFYSSILSKYNLSWYTAASTK